MRSNDLEMNASVAACMVIYYSCVAKLSDAINNVTWMANTMEIHVIYQ